MPLFDYRCTACNSQFELLILGADVPRCPSCGATSLEKELSMFAVSSDGTKVRNWESQQTREQSRKRAVQKERSHYEHDDHHH